MKKQKSDIAVLLDFAGSYKALTFVGLGLSAAAMLLSMVPYICIWLAARDLIAVAPDWTRAGSVARYGWLAFGFAVGHRPLFCRADVYPPGGLPHGGQYPQAGGGPSDAGPAGLVRRQRLGAGARAAGRGRRRHRDPCWPTTWPTSWAPSPCLWPCWP